MKNIGSKTFYTKVLLKDRLPNEQDGWPIFMNKMGNSMSKHHWSKFTEEEMKERFYAFLTTAETNEMQTELDKYKNCIEYLKGINQIEEADDYVRGGVKHDGAEATRLVRSFCNLIRHIIETKLK